MSFALTFTTQPVFFNTTRRHPSACAAPQQHNTKTRFYRLVRTPLASQATRTVARRSSWCQYPLVTIRESLSSANTWEAAANVERVYLELLMVNVSNTSPITAF